MKKRLLCMLLCLALLLSLAGCGRKNQRSEGKSSGEAVSVTLDKPPKKQALFLPPKNQKTSAVGTELSSVEASDELTRKEGRVFRQGISRLKGESFVLRMDTDIDLVVSRSGGRERAKETVTVTANIKDNNKKSMEMSGTCQVTAPNTSLAYDYYCKGDTNYVEYSSAGIENTKTDVFPAAALMNYQLSINEKQIRSARELENGVALLVDGSVLDQKAILQSLVKRFDSVSCDGVELQLYTDEKGRPATLYLFYSLDYTVGDETATADFEQTFAFSSYGKANLGKSENQKKQEKQEKQKKQEKQEKQKDEKDSRTVIVVYLDEETEDDSKETSDERASGDEENRKEETKNREDKTNIQEDETDNREEKTNSEEEKKSSPQEAIDVGENEVTITMDESDIPADESEDPADESDTSEDIIRVPEDESEVPEDESDEPDNPYRAPEKELIDNLSPIAAAFYQKLAECSDESDAYTMFDVTGDGVYDLIIRAEEEEGDACSFYSFDGTVLEKIGGFSGEKSRLYRDENGALIVYWFGEAFGRIDRVSFDGTKIQCTTLSVYDVELTDEDENPRESWESEHAASLYESLELWSVSDTEPLNHADEEQPIPSSEKTELADYIGDLEAFRQLVGGESAETSEEFEGWYIRENLQYGNYVGSSQVDSIELKSAEYQLFRVSVGEDVNQACERLEQDGWIMSYGDEDGAFYEREDRNLSLDFADGTIDTMTFWNDAPGEE